MDTKKKSHSNSKFNRILSLILSVAMVIGCMPVSNIFAAEYDRNKIDVWDFGPTALDETKYNNMLDVDTINKWYEGITPGTAGINFPTTFTAGDLSFVNGRAGSNRLRTTNESVTRWDASNSVGSIKGFDCAAEKIVGCYYANGADPGKQGKFQITCEEGDIIYVWVKMDNGADVINLSKDGKVVSSGDASTDGSVVKLIATEAGTYDLANGGAGKPRIYRITREHAKFIPVTGTITAPSDFTNSYSIMFRNNETLAVTTVPQEAGAKSYSTELAQGYAYTVLLKDAKGFVIETGTTLDTTGKDSLTHNLTIINAIYSKYTYNFTGFAPDYDRTSKGKFYYQPVNPDHRLSYGDVDVALGSGEVELAVGIEYKLVLEGVNDYYVTAGASVTPASADPVSDYAITVAPKAVYSVTGGFKTSDGATVTPAKVTFTNLEDNYPYTATVTDGAYSVKLRDGNYKVTADVAGYTSATYVVVNGAEVTKDIYYLAKQGATALVKDIYVDQESGDNHYKTLKEAIDYVNAMDPAPASEDERVTIHIAPGTYRAQYILTTPYVSLVNTDPSQKVLVTWYYGIGYKYYSADATGYYNELNAVDKVCKNGKLHVDGKATTDVARWAGTFSVRVSAHDFYAENIDFENSFNKYVTQEEIDDGATPNLTQAIRVERTLGLDARSKAATERAAALISEADNSEFYKCSFSSSQDTLYINPEINNYYKDCFVEGMTDYIFGDGEVVFDNCTLNFCGYSDGAVGGYITATKHEKGGNGYLFNECTITGTNENGITAPAGKYGRNWGLSSTVYFVNSTVKDNLIDADGWGNMSGDPILSNYYEYNNKTEDGTAVVSKKGKALTDEDVKAMSIKSFLGGWTPKNYTGNEIVIGGKDPVNPEPGTSTAALGDVDQNGTYTANDAALALSYVLDKANANLTATQIDAAEVNGDKIVTAVDVSQILAKVLDNSFVFTRKDYNPETSSTTTTTTEKVTDATTEKVTDATTEKVTDATTEKTSDTSSEETTEPSGDTKPVIWTLGDSTVCNYTDENVEKYNYRQGWGMRLGDYFTDDVIVKNIAKSGRSSRDFQVYGNGAYYKDFTENLKAGDYVLIQFGHNDEKDPFKCKDGVYSINGEYGKTDANGGISTAAGLDWKTGADENGYVTVDGIPVVADSLTKDGKVPSFEWILYNRYVKVALDKGATPILVTPVVRGKSGEKNSSGKDATVVAGETSHEKSSWGSIRDNTALDEALKAKFKNMNYIAAIKDVAEYAGVPVIDLYTLSGAYWTEYAANHGGIVNDLHANDKGVEGNKDRTHLSRIGAFAASGLVANEIKEQNLGLAKYLKETFPTAPLDGISAGDDDTTVSTEASTESSKE